MKAKWLERSLFLGPYLTLCLSEKEFKSAIARVCPSDTERWLEDGWHACTHSYQFEGSIACIVCLDPQRAAQTDSVTVAALLVHEAVHVWQKVREQANISTVEIEFEAYAIQNISAQLMYAYKERLAK